MQRRKNKIVMWIWSDIIPLGNQKNILNILFAHKISYKEDSIVLRCIVTYECKEKNGRKIE